MRRGSLLRSDPDNISVNLSLLEEKPAVTGTETAAGTGIKEKDAISLFQKGTVCVAEENDIRLLHPRCMIQQIQVHIVLDVVIMTVCGEDPMPLNRNADLDRQGRAVVTVAVHGINRKERIAPGEHIRVPLTVPEEEDKIRFLRVDSM